jgi:hypothetical protein
VKKTTIGLVTGGILGILDGLSAWLSPDARPFMTQIVVGSTIKGLVTGIIVGYVAQRTQSMMLGVGAGLLVGLALSFAAAATSGMPGDPHYFEIMLPGALVGVIAGIVSVKYGQSPNIH